MRSSSDVIFSFTQPLCHLISRPFFLFVYKALSGTRRCQCMWISAPIGRAAVPLLERARSNRQYRGQTCHNFRKHTNSIKWRLNKVCECRVNKLDMLIEAKIKLDVTWSLDGHLLLPEFCDHVVFPRGPLSQNSAKISKCFLFWTVHKGMLTFPRSQWKHSGR